MRKITMLPLFAIALTLPLSGCDWVGGSSADTDMRNVEILPGTASDEMITLDQASGDGTSIDVSVAVVPVAAGAVPTDDEGVPSAGDSGAAEEPKGDTSNNGDVVIRPPSGGAEPSGPATKN